MRDYIFIGSGPACEDVAQVGSEGYAERGKKECRALINQLKRMHGEPPENTSFSIKPCPHDFGTYYEVICYFESEDEKSVDYAYGCEDLPEFWDEEARKELME